VGKYIADLFLWSEFYGSKNAILMTVGFLILLISFLF
jgi:hypothetical protein